MSKQLDIKKCLLQKSDRVKACDLHPREPWIVCSLYSGKVTLWNYESQELVKSFDVVDMPIRAVRFVPRMNWVVCTSDDRMCRVFNYNTMEKVKEFETHQDYIRGVAVHDTQPYIVTCSDDMTAKLWNWEKGYQNMMMFEGHVHYVMCVTFNPKDHNTFATGSLDRTIKVWDVNSWQCNFTLEGHQAGVNAVDYYTGGDKPYLISGSDDRTVKVWDYQTRACVQTLSQHTHNVSCVAFFHEKPLMISGSEDDSVKIWGLQTYRLEASMDYGLGRVWAVATRPGLNKVGIACDAGMVTISIGKEEPVCSMDSNGKVIFAVNTDITQVTIKGNVDEDAQDGDKLVLPTKEMGTTEEPPKRLMHNANGQYVAVISEGEYSVNSALAWRPKSFGKAIDFAWASETNTFAVLETPSMVRIYRNGKVKADVPILGSADKIYGGGLLGVCCDGALTFYDWDTQVAVRQIAALPVTVQWNQSGELVCLVCAKSFFVLRYNREAVAEHIGRGEPIPDDGIEDAFDLLDEIEDQVRRGTWAGDCFLFSNSTQRLNYYMGSEIHNIAVLERPMWLLGYLPKENRIYLADKDRNISSYILYQSVIEYQTLVLDGRLAEATQRCLPNIPQSMRSKVAKFLDQQGHKAQALEVSTDTEHRFDLALQLHRLDLAHEIAALKEGSPTEVKVRWKRLGGLAMQHAEWKMAEEALKAADDHPGLLLLYSSLEDRPALQQLQAQATALGLFNVAFTCAQLCGDVAGCVTLLIDSGRPSSACVFARSYCPAEVPRALTAWKKSLGAARLAEAIADPQEYPNLFPEFEGVLQPYASPQGGSPAGSSPAGSPKAAGAAGSPPAADPPPATYPIPSPTGGSERKKQPGSPGFVRDHAAHIDRQERQHADPLDDDPFAGESSPESPLDRAAAAAGAHLQAAAAAAEERERARWQPEDEHQRMLRERQEAVEADMMRLEGERERREAEQERLREEMKRQTEERRREHAERIRQREEKEEAHRREVEAAQRRREEEEQRRREEEAEQRRQQEEQRRKEEAEAERRRQEEEEQRRREQEAEQRRQQEEQRRKEEAEEERRRQEEEEQRRREEAERRRQEEEEQRRREAEEQQRREEEARAQAAEQERLKREQEEEARRQAEEEARRAALARAEREAEEARQQEAAERQRAEEARRAAAAEEEDGWGFGESDVDRRPSQDEDGWEDAAPTPPEQPQQPEAEREPSTPDSQPAAAPGAPPPSGGGGGKKRNRRKKGAGKSD